MPKAIFSKLQRGQPFQKGLAHRTEIILTRLRLNPNGGRGFKTLGIFNGGPAINAYGISPFGYSRRTYSLSTNPVDPTSRKGKKYARILMNAGLLGPRVRTNSP